MPDASATPSVLDLCRKPAIGPAGYGSATMATEHIWRLHGWENDGAIEVWYCERCRKIDKRWREAGY